MKNRNKVLCKKIFNLILTVAVVGVLFNTVLKVTFADSAQGKPDVIIHIDENGKTSYEGSLFGDELWYPGHEKNGIIRIVNSFKRIKVTQLGLDVDLVHFRSDYTKEIVEDAFLKNMKLSISRDGLLLFKHDLYNNNLNGIAYKEDNAEYNGIDLPASQQFYIGVGSPVDLKYTILMHEDAGNELQDLQANVSLLINMGEDLTPDNGGDDGNNDRDDNNGDNDKDESKPLIEEPQEEIPSIGAPTDINGHWAHDCIVALLQQGIIRGYEDGTIRPDNYITRAEAAAIMSRVLKLAEKSNAPTTYVDVLPAWARGAIIATSEKKVFRGYPGNLFKPEKLITREEMTCVLIRAFNKDLAGDIDLPFADKHEISSWAQTDVKAGVQNKVIGGYPDNTLRPQQYITRAETFAILCRLLGYHQEHGK